MIVKRKKTGSVLGYALMGLLLVAIGFFAFGFELSANQKDNLFYNFILFSLLSLCLLLIPFVNPMNDEATLLYRAQGWAVIFIAWFTTLELFYIGAWVKDLTLVWQPDWMDSIIQWMQAHINVPPLNVDRKLFMLKLSGSGTEELRPLFSSEQEFLASAFGHSAVFLHFIRAVAFFPLLGASIILLWKFVGGNIRVSNTDKLGLGGFVGLIIISFFMIFIMTIAGYGILFEDVGYRAEAVVNKIVWLMGIWLNIGFFFIVIGLKLVIVWLVLGKNFMVNIFNFITR